jgi:chromate transporter
MNAPQTDPQVPMREALGVWAKIGVLSFGGPAGQIALMHRTLVEERRWISEPRFLHALNFCMLLPGPEAMQLATYAGWLMHGWRGGLAAGLLFVLPGAAVVIALSAIYAAFGSVPLVAALFFGVKAAVLAIVVEALMRIARRALAHRLDWAIAASAFLAMFAFNAPFPLVVLAAGLVGLSNLRAPPRTAKDAPSPVPQPGGEAGLRQAFATTALWLAIWMVPLAALTLALGAGHVLSQAGWFFSKLAVVTFGGAYAVLAYMAQQAVENYGWLAPGQMVDGLGLAETTPGPLILVTVFVGFLAGWGSDGAPSLGLALAATVVTLWATFAPCFLWIFALAPYVERLRGNRRLQGALSAITAAVVGVILNLALWFGLHVLFATLGEWSAGPFRLLVPDLSSLDSAAAAIAVIAALALLRFHLGIPKTLALCAALDLPRSWFSQGCSAGSIRAFRRCGCSLPWPGPPGSVSAASVPCRIGRPRNRRSAPGCRSCGSVSAACCRPR